MIKFHLLFNLIITIVGILIGLVFIFIDGEVFLRFLVIGVGIIVILTSIPGFIAAFAVEERKDKVKMILYSSVTAVLGALLIFYPNTIAYIVCGVLLVILPIIKLIFNKDRKKMIKKEIIKIVIGLTISIAGLGSMIQIVFYVFGGLIIVFSIGFFIYQIVAYFKMKKELNELNQSYQDNEAIDV